jgi:hypothetical protein
LLVQVSKIFNDVDASQLEAAAAAGKKQQLEEASLSPEEFAQMRRDVELLGELSLHMGVVSTCLIQLLWHCSSPATVASRCGKTWSCWVSQLFVRTCASAFHKRATEA